MPSQKMDTSPWDGSFYEHTIEEEFRMSGKPIYKRNPQESPMMSADDVADYLLISKHTILDRVKKGLFPAPIKMGGRNLWRKEKIDEFLKTLG